MMPASGLATWSPKTWLPSHLADRSAGWWPAHRIILPSTENPIAPKTCAITHACNFFSATIRHFRGNLVPGPDQKSYRVPGHITIQDTATTISAAKAGLGLAYLLESRIADDLASGQLEIVLEDHASSDDPFHMYYSSRHNNHPGLRGLINIIRKQHGLSRI
jgi:DNA-binding transcriptional LysR family regulator